MLEGELGPDTEIVAQLPLYLPGVVKQLVVWLSNGVAKSRGDLNSDHCSMAHRAFKTEPCRPVPSNEVVLNSSVQHSTIILFD